MNILVIKLGGLGGVVQAFGAFVEIRTHHAAARVTLLTTAPFRDLAEQSPWFDRVLIDECPNWWNLTGVMRLRRQLQGYDFVYDLQNSGRTDRYLGLAGAPPWSGSARGASHPHANPARTLMQHRARLREQLLLAGISDVPAPDLSWFKAGGPILPEPYALLAPGSSPHRPEKRWPATLFGDLAGLIAERGVLPVVVGSGSERDLASAVRAACPSALDLTGQTSHLDLGGIAARASLAVGNDTGPMHSATAVGCPSIVLASAPYRQFTAPGSNVVVLREANLADLALERVAACLP